MGRTGAWVGVAAAVAGSALMSGCGRFGFAGSDGGPGGDDPASDGREPDGGAVVDGAVDANLPPTDADTRPNIAFRSSTTMQPNFASRAAADAICQSLADGESLAGTYLALLATSTELATARLVGSRGWVDVTGTPIADVPADWLGGRMLNPLWRNENGVIDATGASWIGDPTVGTCADWTSSSAAISSSLALPGMPIGANTQTMCISSFGLVCVGIGRVAPVAVSPTTGRVVFISTAGFFPGGGLAGADAICGNEAAAASLPGTYRAALTTSTASAASRFDTTGLPWRRVDGVRLTETAVGMFDAAAPLFETFVSTTAVGAPIEVVFRWTGSATSNCLDWTTSSAASQAQFGIGNSAVRVERENQGNATCNAGFPLLCLQE